MAVKTVAELKEIFGAGKYPSAQDYADLIDSMASAPSIVNLQTNPSSVTYLSNEASTAPSGAIIIVTNNDSGNEFVNAETAYGENIEVTVPPYGSVAFLKKSDGYFTWFGTAIQGGKDGGTQG